MEADSGAWGMPSTATEGLAIAGWLGLQDTAPEPILMGRHLIAMGLRPGRHFGKLLQGAFEAQLNGEFDDLDGAMMWMEEAIAWADMEN